MKPSQRLYKTRSSGQGMATLAVVMILFFVVAMVAAYTNRNLVFEQRTAANSYRSAQALAAADAGVDWTVAMLNGGIIDSNCQGGAGATNDFRSRYLNLLPSGAFQLSTWASAAGPVQTPRPSCTMTDTGWICGCPSSGDTSLPAPSTAEAPVVFSVKMSAWDAVGVPGAIQLTVKGCTSALTGDVSAANLNSTLACHMRQPTESADVDGQARMGTVLGLVSALPVAPVAAVTAGADIVLSGGTTMRASNTDSATGEVLHAGGAIQKASATTSFSGPAGSSTSGLEQQGDSALSSAASSGSGENLFQSLFGMMRSDYQNQPAALRLTCASACTASADLIPALASSPTRIIWVNGDLNIDQATAIGSANLPAMVVVNGDVTISQGAAFTGVIYSHGSINWSNSAASVSGAVVARNNFNANSDVNLAYDAKVVRRLQQSYGSFVRVPGSWSVL
ncbi:PilX N-terminal domain-containing pilus assembly protein [Aquabacterium sp.]|uniref:PilX N-terminal domain-containing pilus assembly protein n=1 Tax=Aquabacterium sp. TaxID=1872578 RepID=UPI00378483A4